MIERAIKEKAAALGFDDCRITNAEHPASAPHLDDWLAEGNHGELFYLERNAEKRRDLQKVLPGARSVISLAINYFSGPEASGEPGALMPDAIGVVARYARFNDYHSVLKRPLTEMIAHLATLGTNEARSLWYVDTGPVLERDLAQRAGLGFVGKHTNVISRKLGNWIFIAEIITTLPLQPDPPEHNRCGSCARCIEACPTAAIKAPFVLDARRCISYLTIELKGAIPEELRPLMGNRIYGCDDCLAVCPWNRFAREASMMARHSRPDLRAMDLKELLRLDDAMFRKRFEGTPMLRTKRRGLLRNACVALGNTGNAGDIPALQLATGDSEELIASHASWAINQIEKRTSAETLRAAPATRPG
jgi:epoxyqueuosine reductase